MFEKLREIKDVVKTEIGLACMKKGGDNPYSGLCSIGWMCSCIDDEIDSLDALHHLMNKKDGAAVDPSLDEKITNARKVIAFLSEDGYDQDAICRIGIICNSLERENGDIDIVMKKCNADEQAIEAAIAAINKYKESIGLPAKWVVQSSSSSALVADSSKSTTKRSSKATAKKEASKPFTVGEPSAVN